MVEKLEKCIIQYDQALRKAITPQCDNDLVGSIKLLQNRFHEFLKFFESQKDLKLSVIIIHLNHAIEQIQRKTLLNQLEKCYSEGLISDKMILKLEKNIQEVMSLFDQISSSIREQDSGFASLPKQVLAKQTSLVSKLIDEKLENRVSEINQDIENIQNQINCIEQNIASRKQQRADHQKDLKKSEENVIRQKERLDKQRQAEEDSQKLKQKQVEIQQEILQLTYKQDMLSFSLKNKNELISETEASIKEYEERFYKDTITKNCATTPKAQPLIYGQKTKKLKFHFYMMINRFSFGIWQQIKFYPENNKLLLLLEQFRQTQDESTQDCEDSYSEFVFKDGSTSKIQYEKSIKSDSFENLKNDMLSFKLNVVSDIILNDAKKFRASQNEDVIPIIMILIHQISDEEFQELLNFLKLFKTDNPKAYTFVMSLDTKETTNRKSKLSQNIIELSKAGNNGLEIISIPNYRKKVFTYELKQSEQNPLSNFMEAINNLRKQDHHSEQPMISPCTESNYFQITQKLAQTFEKLRKQKLEEEEQSALISSQIENLKEEYQILQDSINLQLATLESLKIECASSVQTTQIQFNYQKHENYLQQQKEKIENLRAEIQKKEIEVCDFQSQIELRQKAGEKMEEFQKMVNSGDPLVLFHKCIKDLISSLNDYNMKISALPTFSQSDLDAYLQQLTQNIQEIYSKTFSLNNIHLPHHQL